MKLWSQNSAWFQIVSVQFSLNSDDSPNCYRILIEAPGVAIFVANLLAGRQQSESFPPVVKLLEGEKGEEWPAEETAQSLPNGGESPGHFLRFSPACLHHSFIRLADTNLHTVRVRRQGGRHFPQPTRIDLFEWIPMWTRGQCAKTAIIYAN